MTRRDYELIARAVRNSGAVGYTDHVARSLARDLGETNPRFDSERFIAACKEGRT